jgi:hypothetical protein
LPSFLKPSIFLKKYKQHDNSTLNNLCTGMHLPVVRTD